MKQEQYAARLESLWGRLYKTALLYLDSESRAQDAVDEAVYKGLRSCWRLRQPEYFDTWLTRILINVCKDELRRGRRFVPLEEVPEGAAEDYDALPLKEALSKLPPQLKEVVSCGTSRATPWKKRQPRWKYPEERLPHVNAKHCSFCGWN